MLTCRELIDFLDDYQAGEQPEPVRMEFEKHLADCKHCREYFKTYRDTIALAKGAFRDVDGPVPAEVPGALVQAVISAVGRKD